MKFTLHIQVSNPRKNTKNEIMQAVANYLNRNGYKFDVGYNPNELDVDSFGRA